MVDSLDALMPFGKFKGQPVADMGTTYLMWMVSQDHIRFKRPETMRCALEVLRNRFNEFDNMLAELAQDAPPPEYWKEKRRLRRLRENRRIAYALNEQRAALNAAHKPREREVTEREPERCEPKAPDQVMDGYYFARQHNRDTDVSDLV